MLISGIEFRHKGLVGWELVQAIVRLAKGNVCLAMMLVKMHAEGRVACEWRKSMLDASGVLRVLFIHFTKRECI
jgi:hypothetical protein